MPSWMSSGFSAWNGQSSVTGISFQPAAAGEEPTIGVYQTDSTALSDGCIGESASKGQIYPNSTFMGRTNTGQSTVAIAHEVGHILGLDDQPQNTTPPGIMNKGTGPCATATSTATAVTSSDAANATQCNKKAVQCHTTS